MREKYPEPLLVLKSVQNFVLLFCIISLPHFDFEDEIFYLVADDVIPAISAYIINTINSYYDVA